MTFRSLGSDGASGGSCSSKGGHGGESGIIGVERNGSSVVEKAMVMKTASEAAADMVETAVVVVQALTVDSERGETLAA